MGGLGEGEMKIRYCPIGKCGCENLRMNDFDSLVCDPPHGEYGIFVDQYRTCPWPEHQHRIDLSPKEIVDDIAVLRELYHKAKGK
jgi:hypothetical protein